MPRLSIRLFGAVRVTLEEEPVTGFESDKARALLAYLAVEADRAHQREKLAGMLWPESTEQVARAYLRRLLVNIRRAIGDYEAQPPPLYITRQTIQFNMLSDAWVDVTTFLRLVHTRGPTDQETIHQLEEAIELYRGAFLEGFSLAGSPAFEEWALLSREHFYRLVMDALRRLAEGYERRGEFGRALPHAWRQVELDPWREQAHLQVMRLLALNGQRGAALAQYEACCRTLAEELGVEPARETTALFEQIRTGELKASPALPAAAHAPESGCRPPAFLEVTEERERPVFVARKRQLARLEGFLEQALAGQGCVVFVSGEAGCGKTALLGEFTRRAMEAHPDLLVASGQCNAFSGVGDPYLPFREVLGMLTGDVEARWTAGIIGGEHARRLWRSLPKVVQELLDHGRSLIPALVDGVALHSRAASAAPTDAPWVEQLADVAERGRAQPGGVEAAHLFEQTTNLLCNVAASHPLLLILDDLQWADSASLSLLFHLGRRLAGRRILIGCAYRPEDVALGRHGQRHPLERILAELKRIFGDVWVDLGQVDAVEARGFVHDLLDSEPNRLGEGFRRSLLERTQGHALFTVELLRAMQERGDLVQDEEGRWVEGETLDWGPLPARVEAVIGERIGRLGGELGEILAAASVQGEEFAAQVVARVCGIRERDVIRQLGWGLDRRHRLVLEGGTEQVGPQRLHWYRFRHNLFQQHVYGEMGEIERRQLHRDVGSTLEELYGEQRELIAPQLAWHFTRAGEVDRAVEYHLLAGDRAQALYAHQEAIGHYQQALTMLKDQGNHERAAQTLMKVGLAQHLSFDFRSSCEAYRESSALRQKAAAGLPASPLQPASHALRAAWGRPLTLDPARIGEMNSVGVVDQLFSGLLALGEEMEIVPDVARAWDVAEGGRKYVFHLRDDVQWSDGTPVTALDFEYAWKRVLHPATGSPLASLLYDIKGARPFHGGQVSDPSTVGVWSQDRVTLALELEAPTGHFLNLLALFCTYPVPRHVVEAEGTAWSEPGTIVTNGPFQLQTWTQGKSLVLARNPAYHGRFTGNLRRVELSLLGDPPAHLEMYEADRLDILALARLPPAESIRAWQRHAEEYIPAPALITWYVGWNVSHSPFDDPRVRRAFVRAIDKEALAGVALGSGFYPSTGGFVPPSMPGHSEGIGLPHDPERARQLLSEAGYPGGRGLPVLELLIVNTRGPVGKFLQAEWGEHLGVEVRCVNVGLAEMNDRLAGDPPPIFSLAWRAEYPDPDNFLRVAPIRQYSRWRNRTYDRLLEQATRCTDQGERMRLYGQADRMLIDEAVIMPYAYGRFDLLVKPWVRGLPTSATRYWFWKDVLLEPH